MKTGTAEVQGDSTGRRAPVSESVFAEMFRRLCKNKAAMISISIFIIICLACALAPYITRYSYTTINVQRRSEGPSLDHLLGTDNLGRDQMSRLLHGGRVTLTITFSSTILAAIAGSILGLLAGYFGGVLDYFLSPVIDVLAALPIIILALVFEIVFGWGRGYFMYAIAIAAIPQFARLVRATVTDIMGREYIEAARALGASNLGIVSRHILHNIAPSFVIRFTTSLAEALMTCTIMGYLSVGIRPPIPEWGSIALNAKAYMRVAPFMMVVPCAVIAACIISINLFGDGLRDAFDPRDHGPALND